MRPNHKLFGDPDYKGAGVIKCFICGESVVTHAIAPCPEAQERILHIAGPSVQTAARRRYRQQQAERRAAG